MRTLAIALAVVAPAALLTVGCGSGGTHAGSPAQGSSPSQAGSTHAAASPHPASAAVLVSRLKAAGLPVRHLIVYTPSTDPNHEMGRQGGYTSKVAWVDPRAVKAGAGNPAGDRGGIQFGGGIEVFPTAAGAKARYQLLKGFTAPFGDGYDYLSGPAILRLSQYLIPAQARAYEAAFAAAAR
jgi:hypothetical protein